MDVPLTSRSNPSARDTEVTMSTAAPSPIQPTGPSYPQAGGIPLGATTRVVLSLRVGMALAMANILCVTFLAWAWCVTHPQTKSLSVTGSAKQAIRSDLIVWKANVSASAPTMAEAFTKLQDANTRTV